MVALTDTHNITTDDRVSIVLRRDTFGTMDVHFSTLAAFVRERLTALGVSQTQLADRAGLSKSDINGIVQGRIKLPGPEKRRELAKALGVSHLDLLVAAGEITEQEIAATGAVGVIERDPDDRRERLIQRIREMPDGFGVDEGLEVALGVLEAAVKRGREGKGV